MKCFLKNCKVLILFLIFISLALISSTTNTSAQEADDEFTRIELFPERETREAEDSIKTETIDIERDLGLSEIESLLILLVVLFAMVVIMSVLSAMKKISTLILIIGLVGVLFAVALVGFEMFMRSSFLGDIYSNTDYLWEDTSLDKFVQDELTDIPHSYSREIEPLKLANIFSVSDRYLRNIDSALNDIWQSNEHYRESIVIEFNTREEANNFVNQIFIEESNTKLRRGSYSQGTFRTEDENYRRGYLMNDNRFVFLAFSDEVFSDSLFDHLMESYPEEYRSNDNKPPEIEIISPTITNIDEIIFKVSDRESGINQLSIAVTNSEFNSVNDCRKNNNVRYDEYICATRGLENGKNNIVIIASDREKNNANIEIEYVLDKEKPTIEITGRTKDKIIAKIVDNFDIKREGITLKTNDKEINAKHYCNSAHSVIICEFPIEGETMTILATDRASNSVHEDIELDFTSPIINFVNPKDKYTNKQNIEFFISDEKSGLKRVEVEINEIKINICSVVDSKRQRCRHELTENRNVLKIIAEDNSGNILNHEQEIVLDNTPPTIVITTRSDEILDFYIRDESSGIDTERITINSGTFYAEDICSMENGGYRCTYNIRNDANEIVLKISDNAGNTNEVREQLYS